MSKTVLLGSESFEIPLENENPGYGEELSDFFESVAESINNLQSATDIPLTTSIINNNVSTPVSIPGFAFSTALVQSIDAEYLVFRSTVSPAVKYAERGEIKGSYDGSAWNISITREGDAGVSLDITAGGQITYTSSNITGSGYVSTIKFRARTINNIT